MFTIFEALAQTSRTGGKALVTIMSCATIAFLSAACSGGGEATATGADTPQAADTSTAATTTEPPPLSAAEQAWWRQVDRYSKRLEKQWHRSEVTLTHLTMRRWSSLFAQCKATLKDAGDPGRYAPAARPVRRACGRLAKARGQLAIAIGASGPSGAVLAGSPEESQFNKAIDRVFALAENALNDFSTANARASTVEAEFGT